MELINKTKNKNYVIIILALAQTAIFFTVQANKYNQEILKLKIVRIGLNIKYANVLNVDTDMLYQIVKISKQEIVSH